MTGDVLTGPETPPPIAPGLAARWMLDPGVDYLNHGSFGARLRTVYAAQCRWREQFEARPVEFLDRRGRTLIDQSKRVVGAFLGMRADDFGFVTNTTDGVNAVLRSRCFERGERVLTTSHAYPAVGKTIRYLARRAGAEVVEVEIPLPIRSPDAVVEAVAGALSAGTRMLVIEHVTSPTGLVLPVEPVIALCRERGVDVLVDGAHAPGMLDLDVEALGAAYYAGNLHKWVGAPPGAAFLWVRPDRQDEIHPTVISHFLDEGLSAEFAWQGTRDISPWLAAAEAITAMDEIAGPGCWPRIREHNHALATWVQARLAAAWQVPAHSPPDGSMLGSLVSLPVPERVRRRWAAAEVLQRALHDRGRVEVPIFEWSGRWLIRASCQIYNTPPQYERLAELVMHLPPDAAEAIS